MEKMHLNSLLNGPSRMLWAFIGGAASGAALAYFTSPRSGPENRRALRDAVDNSIARARELPTVIRDETASLVSATSDKLRPRNDPDNGSSTQVALEVSAPETAPSVPGDEPDLENS